jgi:hypothetical protein
VAGFSPVGLVYELLDITYTTSEEQARRSIAMRENPTARTWAEAAYHALGAKADDYLRKLVQSRTARPTRTINAVAYISADRPPMTPDHHDRHCGSPDRYSSRRSLVLGHTVLVERSHGFAFEGSRDCDAQVVFEPGAGEEVTRDGCV